MGWGGSETNFRNWTATAALSSNAVIDNKTETVKAERSPFCRADMESEHLAGDLRVKGLKCQARCRCPRFPCPAITEETGRVHRGSQVAPVSIFRAFAETKTKRPQVANCRTATSLFLHILLLFVAANQPAMLFIIYPSGYLPFFGAPRSSYENAHTFVIHVRTKRLILWKSLCWSVVRSFKETRILKRMNCGSCQTTIDLDLKFLVHMAS
jgi:hypothetical protein